LLIPSLTQLRGRLDIGQRPRDALVGAINILIDRNTLFGLEAVFFIPDIL